MKVLLIVLLAVGGSTVFGMLAGIPCRKMSHRTRDMVMGGAAGVMLAAAVFGLLGPAFAFKSQLPLAVPGAFFGAWLVSILDRIVPHLHRLAGTDTEEHANNRSLSRTLLFVCAVALHKIPEGLAAGVSFGTGELGEIITVAGSISLQNIPEALVIVAPLYSIGISTRRVMAISGGIALLSICSVLAGYGLISVFSQAAPALLATAGGAMLYVISDEMIPETHAHGFQKPATFSLLTGFILIMCLQTLLN